MPKLLVALVSDTEDNHPSYVPEWRISGSNYDANPCALKWSWTKYWSCLSEFFQSKRIPITWMIRVDDGPMKANMLSLFKSQILKLKSNGDEIGIHPHTFVWNSQLSKWVQTKDLEQEVKIVRNSLDMFKKTLGFVPLSIRMGWNTMSNELMRTLDARGLIVDSSAIPGTACTGKFGGRDNIYDWSRAPNVPYHPDYEDYQSRGKMKILEIPVSTLAANKSSTFARAVNKLSGAQRLSKLLPIARRLNLTPHSSFYVSPWWAISTCEEVIETYYRKAVKDGIAFLVGWFHACDIINPANGNRNSVFEQYFARIIKKITSLKGIDVTFTTLAEMARSYNSSELTQEM